MRESSWVPELLEGVSGKVVKARGVFTIREGRASTTCFDTRWHIPQTEFQGSSTPPQDERQSIKGRLCKKCR